MKENELRPRSDYGRKLRTCQLTQSLIVWAAFGSYPPENTLERMMETTGLGKTKGLAKEIINQDHKVQPNS